MEDFSSSMYMLSISLTTNLGYFRFFWKLKANETVLYSADWIGAWLRRQGLHAILMQAKDRNNELTIYQDLDEGKRTDLQPKSYSKEGWFIIQAQSVRATKSGQVFT